MAHLFIPDRSQLAPQKEHSSHRKHAHHGVSA
jgi:hypothetical protein